MKPKSLFFLFSLLIFSFCSDNRDDLAISSPKGNIDVVLNVEDGKVFYRVLHQRDTVLHQSMLGLILDDEDLSGGLSFRASSAVSPVSKNYRMYSGKQADITYRGNERTFHFLHQSGRALDITFRVSDDGVGFRYILPDSTNKLRVITNEITEFNFPERTKSWLQPMSVAKTGWEKTNPSYEEFYEKEISTGTPSPLGEGWVYPALFNSGDIWMLITEAAVDKDYCGTRLKVKANTTTLHVDFPQAAEVWPGKALKPNSSATPWKTPWRVIAIGSLETIVQSTLGTDFADPAINIDTTFIKPGYASWSWALWKDNSITYDIQKDFIDYASDMNWKYTLVDVNWDTTIGYERIEELSRYALSKDVGLLLWYNSAGDWNTTPYHPKSKLLTHEKRVEEFSRLRDMGIKGVKIDFFGGDGQSMIAYYHEILKDAAAHGLLVNFHGCTLPRGWHRTYPNLMTAEAIRGEEFITFFQDNADRQPSHCTILPFTRNAFDPMDFTPMVLDSIPNIHRRTTNGFELALPTLFLSGIQHMAETPRGMSVVPDYVKTYLKNLPVQWDETRYVAGYPGKDVVIARRSGDTWYVSGINGERKEKELLLDLSFLKGAGFIITDGAAKKSFEKDDFSLQGESYKVKMKGNGGFVMKVKT